MSLRGRRETRDRIFEWILTLRPRNRRSVIIRRSYIGHDGEGPNLFTAANLLYIYTTNTLYILYYCYRGKLPW